MRSRFTQIDMKTTGNNSSVEKIPVGAEAENITFSNGMVLEDAFGDLQISTKGSINTQLESILRKVDSDESKAPIKSPFFQNSLFLRRYGKENIIYSMPHFSGSENAIVNNISVAYLPNTDEWSLKGTILNENSSSIILYGKESGEDINLLKAGRYEYKIIVSEDSSDETDTTYLQFLTKNGTAYNIDKTHLEGTIEITENDEYLTNISFIIPENSTDTFINKIFRIQLIDIQDTLKDNKYYTVFDIQQSLATKKWKTTISENLSVVPGLQEEARSSLGTIYDSKWEGFLNISRTDNKKTGVIVQDSGIGFQLTNLNSFSGSSVLDKVNNYNQLTSELKDTTPYRIYGGYLSDGTGSIFYDSNNSHKFRINNTEVASIGNTISLSKPIVTNSNLTINGGTLKINEGKFYSPDVPIEISKQIDNEYALERIIFDNTNYPPRQLLCMVFTAECCQGLLGNHSKKTNWSGYGIGYKTGYSNIIFYLFGGNNKIYFVQYGWSLKNKEEAAKKWTSLAQTQGCPRYKTIYSITVGKEEYINKALSHRPTPTTPWTNQTN